jgi:1-deoxy-D-xylulose-5-phosphate reductoisomerase
MKKKICILGSTGSIGKTTLEIISKNKKDFDVVLLSGNNNVKLLITQAKNLNPNIFIQIIFILRRNLEFSAKIIISI